jgi:hypothetical protein
MLVLPARKYIETRHLGFHILHIISTAAQEMPNIRRNRMISVTHIAIHRHRNWCKFFYILNGLYMAIPEKKGDGWIGDPRTWVLDVGALSSRLYFYQVIVLFLLTFAISNFVI